MPIVGILVPSLKSAEGMEIDMMIVNTAPMLIQNQKRLPWSECDIYRTRQNKLCTVQVQYCTRCIIIKQKVLK